MTSKDDKNPKVPEQSEPVADYEFDDYDFEEMDDYEELLERYLDCIPDNDLDICHPRGSDAFLEWANTHRGASWHQTGTRAEAQGFVAAEQARHRHNIPADTRSPRVRSLVQKASESGHQRQPSLHKPEHPSKLSREVLPGELADEGEERGDGRWSPEVAASAVVEDPSCMFIIGQPCKLDLRREQAPLLWRAAGHRGLSIMAALYVQEV